MSDDSSDEVSAPWPARPAAPVPVARAHPQPRARVAFAAHPSAARSCSRPFAHAALTWVGAAACPPQDLDDVIAQVEQAEKQKQEEAEQKQQEAMYSAESSLDALAEAGGDKSYKVKVRAPHAGGGPR